MLDSWPDKRMTGARVSWRIENKTPTNLEVIVEELGRKIQTPYMEKEFDMTYYQADHSYQASLLFPESLVEKLAGGLLVVELEVDTREEEGWNEEVSFSEGQKVFKLVKEIKTWEEAEAHCQMEGGHLASVTSEVDIQQLKNLLAEKEFWVGGTDVLKEGVWRW